MREEDNTAAAAATDVGRSRPPLVMPLPSNTSEVLSQLFMNGPTWDGDIVSKSGRDQLFQLGLASRENGWSFLTVAGVAAGIMNRLDEAKQVRQRERADAARMLAGAGER